MTDIVLVQPPIRDFYLTYKRTVPYGLCCLAGSLIRDGFSVEIFDSLATSKKRAIDLPESFRYTNAFYGKKDLSTFGLFHGFKHFGYSFTHIAHSIQNLNPFLVGISALFTAYAKEALETASIIKQFHPNCRIVMGGHHPTIMPESIMSCQAVDFVIRGEGEVGLSLLAKYIRNEKYLKERYLKHIKGLVFRKIDGSLSISAPALMDNLGNYPPPALQLVKHTFYQRHKKGSTAIVTSRGCPMHCSYCCVGSSTSTYRKRSVTSVWKEIKTAVDTYNVRFIDFEDENLSLDRTWFLELLQRIIDCWGSTEIELRAMNGLYPASLDETVITKMKQAGFKTLNLSLGSASKEQLERFKRPDVRESFKHAAQLATLLKLKTVGYIIVGAPNQMSHTSLDDLITLFKNDILAGVSVYYPAPGSHDYNFCSRMKLLPHSFELMRSSVIPISHTTSRIEAVTLMRLGRIQNFLKSLKEQKPHHRPPEQHLPDPNPLQKNRLKSSLRLLSYFFKDGIIRGIDETGRVYQHETALHLTHTYINKMKKLIGNDFLL